MNAKDPRGQRILRDVVNEALKKQSLRLRKQKNKDDSKLKNSEEKQCRNQIGNT